MIVDLAKYILEGKEISVAVPYVNLVSQRDANERAIRALEICSNPPSMLNVSGPVYRCSGARRENSARCWARTPILVGEEPELCQVINDDFCVEEVRAISRHG